MKLCRYLPVWTIASQDMFILGVHYRRQCSFTKQIIGNFFIPLLNVYNLLLLYWKIDKIGSLWKRIHNGFQMYCALHCVRLDGWGECDRSGHIKCTLYCVCQNQNKLLVLVVWFCLEDHPAGIGCWLGDPSSADGRAWFCGDPKIITKCENYGLNPVKLALALTEALFTREEMAASNVRGTRGKESLNPSKIKAIKGKG